MKNILISLGIWVLGVAMFVVGFYLWGYVVDKPMPWRTIWAILGYTVSAALIFSGILIALSSFISGVQFWKEDRKRGRPQT